MSDQVPDVYVLWHFQAFSTHPTSPSTHQGDVWYGWSVYDQNVISKGATFRGFYGTYVVNDVRPANYDLSYYHGAAYQEGATHVTKYWDAESQVWLVPIEEQQGQLVGKNGMGSEGGHVTYNGRTGDFTQFHPALNQYDTGFPTIQDVQNGYHL